MSSSSTTGRRSEIARRLKMGGVTWQESDDTGYLLDLLAVCESALVEVAHHADDECGFMVNVRAALGKLKE